MEDQSLRWDAPQRRNFTTVPKDAVLTHLGKMIAGGAVFEEEPLWRESIVERWVEVDISMIEGAKSIEETVQLVRRRPQSRRSRKKDCVRYFIVADLMSAGYVPRRTPTRGNPQHVSVYGDMAAMISRAKADFARILIDQPIHQWWWGLPDRVTLESIELARRLPDA